MTLLAFFDSTVAAPCPVLGWYDTDAYAYPSLPVAANLLPLTQEQWDGRMTGLWAVQGGALVAYTAPAPVLTFAQLLAAALAAGCAIVSTGTPALSATYACDSESRADIMGEMLSLLLGGTFTNGQTTLEFSDASGAFHSFTVADFKVFATTIGGYVGALKGLGVVGSGPLPAQPVTIP